MIHHLLESKKPHGCEKSTSWVVIENTLDQSDCIFFKILISQKLFEVESLLFHVIRNPSKLQFDHEVFFGCGQAYLACP